MRRHLLSALATVLVLLAAYLAWLSTQIARQSALDEARPADVIVVLGAAKYYSNPSPVLRARLEHALGLYRRGLAPRIITTGGGGGDPVFTEGEVGRGYLTKRGVPSEAILVDPEGESTSHSIAAVAEIMRQHEIRSCIVVSDGYHIYRVKRMLQHYGFDVYGSPRPEAPRDWQQRVGLYTRQAVAYFLWSVGVVI